MKKYLGIISVLLTLVITLSLPATVTQATEIPATEIEATEVQATGIPVAELQADSCPPHDIYYYGLVTVAPSESSYHDFYVWEHVNGQLEYVKKTCMVITEYTGMRYNCRNCTYFEVIPGPPTTRHTNPECVEY